MRANDATTSRWRRKNSICEVLALLGLVGIGLPASRAQLEYDGGYVQTHREDGAGMPSWAPRHPEDHSNTNTSPSYYPDHDSYYPSYFLAKTSVTRSYYPGDGTGNPISPPLSGPRSDLSETALPWNQVGFKDYDEPRLTARDSALFSPRKYILEAHSLPQGPLGERPGAAVLIAHLPRNAVLWVEGTRTGSTGRTRYFQSPLLRPGRRYSYKVRAAWIEDGRWVSQSRKVPVQAGTIEALYLRSRNDSDK